jgi:hypothetical protein
MQKIVINLKARYFDTNLKLFLICIGFLIIAGSMWSSIQGDSGTNNLYAYQAQAFLQGHLDIKDVTSNMSDIAIFNGHNYVVFPPFPAVVLLPFVAVFGIENTRPVLIAIFLTILNIYLFTLLLKKVGTQKQYIPWLLAAFFLGTGYWLVLRWSTAVWFFAQIVATTCILLTLNEAFGKARGALIGLFLGMAVLSRQNTIFYVILVLAILWSITYPANQNKRKWLNIFSMLAILGLWGGLYLFLNWLRFGSILDTGYAHILNAPGFLADRVNQYGVFNIAYIPFNFINLFVQGFQVQFDATNSFLSITGTSLFGTSLTFASPFLFMAIMTRWEKKLLSAAWISVGCILGVMLIYYSNGWWQQNTQRYALDFIPILVLLLALGMKRINIRILQALVSYSVVLNIFAMFIIPLVVKLFS